MKGPNEVQINAMEIHRKEIWLPNGGVRREFQGEDGIQHGFSKMNEM